MKIYVKDQLGTVLCKANRAPNWLRRVNSPRTPGAKSFFPFSPNFSKFSQHLFIITVKNRRF